MKQPRGIQQRPFLIQTAIFELLRANASREVLPYYLYVVHVINEHTMTFRGKQICRLCATKLQKVIPGRQDAKVIRHLQEWDAIQLVQDKKIGKHCRGFAIGKEFVNDDYLVVPPGKGIKLKGLIGGIKKVPEQEYAPNE